MKGQVLYHGTAKANVPGILARGLVPHGGKGADAYAAKTGLNVANAAEAEAREGVFLTPDKGIALWYAEMAAKLNQSAPAVLKVCVPPAVKDALIPDELGDTDDKTNRWGFRMPGPVPAKWIEGELPARALATIKKTVPPIPTQQTQTLLTLLRSLANEPRNHL